jgi:hypothetical protein
VGETPFEGEELADTSDLLLHHKVSTALDSITSKITVKEWVGKMNPGASQ